MINGTGSVVDINNGDGTVILNVGNNGNDGIFRCIIKYLPYFPCFLPFFGSSVPSNYMCVIKIMYSIWFLGIV